MNATDAQKVVEQFKTAIFNDVRHSALLRNTGEPRVDDNRMFYLLLPFLNGEKQDSDAVIVGIVHAALAAHDLIEEKDATTKEQQLMVLAGDYYSGRYYQILAETGNIRLIRALSSAIVARCEQKVRGYEQGAITFQDWLISIEMAETALIEAYFNEKSFTQYTTIMKKGILLIRLFEEQQAIGRLAEKLKVNDVQREITDAIQVVQQTFTTEVQQSALSSELKELVLKCGMKKSEV